MCDRVGLLAVFLALGWAGCGGGEDEQPSTDSKSPPAGTSEGPRFEAATATTGKSQQRRLPKPVAPPPPEGSTGETVNVIGEAPPPKQLVERCEDDPQAQGDCGLVLAIAAGDVPPGRYSTPELKKILREAGYDDGF
jgi:hypothetical protein